MRLLIVAILSIVLLAACGESERNNRLLQCAERVMENHPDSALAILCDSIDTTTLCTDRSRALYALLLSQAYDKNYIDISSDSIIAPAVEYFADVTINEDSIDVRYAMLTNYYLGRIKFNCNDLGASLVSNLYAEQFGLAILDYEYLAMIYRSLAYINNNAYNYQDELKYAKLALKYFDKANKYEHLKWAKLDLATAYNNNKMIDDAILLYKASIDSSVNNCDSALMFETLSNYAHATWLKNDYISAKNALIILLENQKINAVGCGHLSQIYTEENKLDSARQIIDYGINLINSGFDKVAIYNSIYHFHIAQNNTSDALTAKNELYNLKNEMVDSAWTQSLMRVQSEYYKSLSAINEQKVRNKQLLLYFTSIGLVAVCLLFCLFQQYSRRKTTQNRLRIFQLESINKEQRDNSKEQLELVKSKISTLESELLQYREISKQRLDEINSYKEHLECIKYNIENNLKNRENLNDKFLKDELILTLKGYLMSGKNLSLNDWESIDQLINSTFQHFHERLVNLCNITDKEYKICLLIKCDFSPTEIARLINMSKGGLGNLRKRLYYKAFKSVGSASDWDKFILSL